MALTLLAVVPALASNTWFVDGANGSDNNNCQARQHACKTISNAMLLTLPGDSIIVAPATYHESLFIPFELKIIGSGAKTTIIDARGLQSQVVVVGSEPRVQVTLSGMTLRNGSGQVDGGGIYNCFGTLTVSDSVITHNRIGGVANFLAYGGAIYNCPFSTLTLINTTISDNSAQVGGAICTGGLLDHYQQHLQPQCGTRALGRRHRQLRQLPACFPCPQCGTRMLRVESLSAWDAATRHVVSAIRHRIQARNGNLRSTS